MSLPEPDTRLRVSVVVPAKNEEERIASCLDALARQVGVKEDRYEVLLVLDGCSDSTPEIVEEWKKTNHLALRVLYGPSRGVGSARKLGMDVAYSRLSSVAGERALISSTDADSVVAADWIAAQISLMDLGAEAIGGRIKLEKEGKNLHPHVLEWYESQSMKRFQNIRERYRDKGGSPQEHWQFSGASMSLTTGAYRKIGGLGAVEYLEDEHLERALEAAGIEIHRSLSVRVTTSSRTVGRAEMGLAEDLRRTTSELSVKDKV